MLHDTPIKIKNQLVLTHSISSTYDEIKSRNAKPDESFIRAMFDGLARRYDLFNTLTSLGLAGLWRAKTVESLKPGMCVLDIGCGTGDLVFASLSKIKGEGEVVGIDFSSHMLEVARHRHTKLQNKYADCAKFIEMSALDLPITGQKFDCAVSGFVLRNLYQNIDTVLKGARESLKEGGFIRFLDITEPRNTILKNLWVFYMHTATAFYGRLLFGKNYPKAYLVDSAGRFLKADEFTEKLRAHGFKNVGKKSFLFGIITLYSAEK